MRLSACGWLVFTCFILLAELKVDTDKDSYHPIRL